MRLLLDSHLLLWAVARSERLPREARQLLEDDDNEVYYSAASIWEIAIKSALGRKDFRIDLTQVHEYRESKLIVKWDLDNQKAMKGRATRGVIDLIAMLQSEACYESSFGEIQ